MNKRRALLLAPAILFLLLGMLAGLRRLGWPLPALPTVSPALAAVHGPLMVSGFLGALIGLERVVALRLSWGYLSPVLTLAGSLLLLTAAPASWGALLIFCGSLLLVVVAGLMVRHHPALHTVIIALGVVAWAAGNALWLAGRPIYQVVPWWIGFLVLTIAGERLELSRVLRLTRQTTAFFLGCVTIFGAGLIVSVGFYDAGVRIMGAGMLLLALWLVRYDIARRTVRRSGLTRYIASCLLAGYIWLGVSGVLSLSYGGVPAGPYYDAMLHTIFLGFAFSMIFGHAPIIFPALLERPIQYSPASYTHLVLLQVSLLLRIAGDIWLWPALRRWGGMLNVLVLLLFLANTVWSLRPIREDPNPTVSASS